MKLKKSVETFWCSYRILLLRFSFHSGSLELSVSVLIELISSISCNYSSGSGGGAEGAMAPPGPVKIGHKKDGRLRKLHRFHVSRPPPYPAAGSATELLLIV